MDQGMLGLFLIYNGIMVLVVYLTVKLIPQLRSFDSFGE